MASVVTEVTYSKNPVNVNEVFKISITVVETPETVIIHCGTFKSGQEIKI